MMASEKMDVDTTDVTTSADGAASSNSSLKRSCSAPMIDQILEAVAGAASRPPPSDQNRRDPSPAAATVAGASPSSSTWRSRRLSANYGSISSPSSPHGVAPRVQQLKKEEGLDEARHESALHSTLKLSQSWGDLTVTDEGSSSSTGSNSISPLTVNLGPWTAPCATSPVAGGLSSSSSSSSHAPSFLTAQHPHLLHHQASPLPSPTRGVRVNASSLPMRSISFSPSPSPSPTRRTFTTRRSQSPIAMRASQLLIGSVKRKCEVDPTDDSSSPAPKRLFTPLAGLLMPGPPPIMDSPSPSGASSSGNPGFDTPPPSVGSTEGTPGVAKSTPATPGSLAKAMEDVMVTSAAKAMEDVMVTSPDVSQDCHQQCN